MSDAEHRLAQDLAAAEVVLAVGVVALELLARGGTVEDLALLAVEGQRQLDEIRRKPSAATGVACKLCGGPLFFSRRSNGFETCRPCEREAVTPNRE